LTNNL